MAENTQDQPEERKMPVAVEAPAREYKPMPAHRSPALVRWLSSLFIKLLGWKVVGDLRKIDKFVIVSQHTSNWDIVITLPAALTQGVMPHWLGKKEIFSGPRGRLMRFAGGIPVDRSRSTSVVKQVAQMFAERDSLVLFIAPAGTRGTSTHWKTGFYYIALEAGVPIALGILDYKRKVAGIDRVLWPSGDLEADMAIIRGHFENIQSRHPDKETPIQTKSAD